jgi:hypothetical protein
MPPARRALALLVLALAAAACPQPSPAPAAPAPVDGCDAARAELEHHLESVPRQCANDAECRAQYVRGDACAPPVVAAAAWDPGGDATLQALQAKVRGACPMVKRPACEPVMVRPGCRMGQCVDDKGTSGTARRVCGPGGGVAWSFFFTDGREATCEQTGTPSITAAIWHDVDAGDRFTVDATPRSSGVLTRCRADGRCVTGTGTLRVSGKHDGGFVVELDGAFDGEAVQQSFFARPCPGDSQCP